MKIPLKKKSILPGFGLTLGFTLTYLGLIVLLPLSTIFFETARMGWREFWGIATSPRVLASYRLGFGASFAGAAINLIFGSIVALVLVRYHFPAKRVIDALIDLPFALPTAVAGIALTTGYASNGWIGRPLGALGVKVAYTPLGIIVALTFIGFPFVVRTLEPVLQDFDHDIEEAAACLGANRLKTFLRVIFPELLPALLTGFTQAFARAIGEYGSVVFISGNMPMRTEIPALLIMTKLEQYDYAGANAIAFMMLLVSSALLLTINGIQRWSYGRYGVR